MWAPDPQLTRHMVGLLQDIQSTDNNRQSQILQEMGNLSNRPDFALYLVFLTSGCPNSGIEVSEHARIAACTRLSRVFRDKISPSRQALTPESAQYIRDSCIQYLNTTNPLIKSCIIDVLAYLAIYQQLVGWENIMLVLLQWLRVANPAQGSQEYVQKETAGELIHRIVNELTNNADLTDSLMVENDEWASQVWKPLFELLIDLLIDANVKVRHSSAATLADCIAWELPPIVNNSMKLINNLMLLATNDKDHPKSQVHVFSMLSSIATLNTKYVFGFSQENVKMPASTILAAEKAFPTPTLSTTIDLTTNPFSLIDNLLLLASQTFVRKHEHCHDEFNQCEAIYDHITSEALQFFIAVLHTNSTGTMMVYRQALVRRHINHYLPLVFKMCQHTGCDLIDLETQEKTVQEEFERARRELEQGAEITAGAIQPHFNKNSLHSGDDEDYEEAEVESGENDDNDDEDEEAVKSSKLRQSCQVLIDLTIHLDRAGALSVFGKYVNAFLLSQDAAERENGIFLLAIFGHRCASELQQELSQSIPHLIDLMGDNNTLIRATIPWCISKLASTILDFDEKGMKSTDGQHTIAQRFFLQSIQLLLVDKSYRLQYNIAKALEEFSSHHESYFLFLQYYMQLNEACLFLLHNTLPQFAPSFTSLFSTLIETIAEDGFQCVDQQYFVHKMCRPFLQLQMNVTIHNEALGDWLLATQKFIQHLPIESLTSLAPPLYSRLLEIASPLSVAMHDMTLMRTRGDDQYYDELPWGMINAWNATQDCINALIERLESNFLSLATSMPLPTSLQSYLYPACERIVWMLDSRNINEFQSMGTLPLLIDTIIIGLSYEDSTTTQSCLATVGELCNQIPHNDLLYKLYMNCVPVISSSLSVDPNNTELMSNACWAFKVMLNAYKGQLFEYFSQKYTEQVTANPNGPHRPNIMSILIEKLFIYIAYESKLLKPIHEIILTVFACMADNTPTELLTMTTSLTDSDPVKFTSSINSILSKLLQKGTFKSKWAASKSLSRLLPLILQPNCQPQFVEILKMFLQIIVAIIEGSQVKLFTPSDEVIQSIKANFGQVYQQNQAMWVHVFGLLSPQEQASLKNAFQL